MSSFSVFKKISLVDTPTASNDATTKAYVDAVDGRQVTTITTANNTPTTVATVATTTDTTILIVSQLTAIRTDVADSNAAFQIRAGFKNTSGTVTQLGADDLASFVEPLALPYTVDTSISGTNIIIRVTGETGHTVDWKATTYSYVS